MRPIKVGISACLLGDEVRYDGGHKRDPFLADTFGRFVEWVPVCPEVECGLGTPREAIRLVRDRSHSAEFAVLPRRDRAGDAQPLADVAELADPFPHLGCRFVDCNLEGQ